MITPKPCPFCGLQYLNEEEEKYEKMLEGVGCWTTLYVSEANYPSDQWFVHCGNCGARGPSKDSETLAIKHWNKIKRTRRPLPISVNIDGGVTS